MDLQAIINDHPEVVLVDELAHTNVEGSKNKKRWQDVFRIMVFATFSLLLNSVHQGILEYVNQHNITTVCIGKPRHKLWQRISGYSWIYTFIQSYFFRTF